VRTKLPGGRLRFDRARALADAARRFADSALHATTRQGIQFYGLALDRLAPLLEALNEGGVSTREAAGSTFRAIVACPLAGLCPHEHVDAGAVADRLAQSWLRHPLVQHMPRKVKTAVSGCAQDCGGAGQDDLGFIATLRDGKPGFRVLAGGGLGSRPELAVPVIDFVAEEDLPAVQEAVARIHHRHSNRADRNAARLKFLIEREGALEFAALIRREFQALRDLPGRPWKNLAWRTPNDDAGPAPDSVAPFRQTDGRLAVTIALPLGRIEADQLDGLAGIAESLGGRELRLTRAQNVMVIGLAADRLDDLASDLRALGLVVARAPEARSVVACPGCASCAIGITDSPALGLRLRRDDAKADNLPTLRLQVSGCANACGRHHTADIGLHGLAKKIAGQPRPHYQLHIGGANGPQPVVGRSGPVIAEDAAPRVIDALAAAFRAERQGGESFQAWAARQSDDAIAARVAQAVAQAGGDAPISTLPFAPPANAKGECGAPAVVAEYLGDLARVAIEDVERHRAIGNAEAADRAAQRARKLTAERLAAVTGAQPNAEDARLGLGDWLARAEERIERHLLDRQDAREDAA
jgi:sulfite reductase beta subunit-like hemoprotein